MNVPSTPARRGARSSNRMYPATPGSRRRSPRKISLLQLSKLSLNVADTNAQIENVAVVDLTQTRVTVGFGGRPEPVSEIRLEPVWRDALTDQEPRSLGAELGPAGPEMVGLEALFRRLLLNELLVDPKRYRIMAVVSPAMTDVVKGRISEMLFARFAVNSVVFQSSAVFSMVSAGSRNGLVVLIDWDHTTIVPVIDFREVSSHLRMTSRGQRWIYELLKTELRLHDALSAQDVTELLQTTDVFGAPDGGKVALAGSEVDSAKVRAIVEQSLFGTLGAGAEGRQRYDDEEQPLQDCIEAILGSLDISARGDVLSHIVIANNSVRGLESRLLEQLRRTGAAFIHSQGSWTGASLYLSSVGWLFAHEERALFPGEITG